MSSQRFSLSWDCFHKNMSTGMNSLLENEDLVDVTLAVEGRYLKAHKVVLSVCSPYFRDLFKTTSCKHPIVFMKDMSYDIMSDLLQFMYQGEVQVSQESFTTFVNAAESLQIRGLSNYDNQVPTKRGVESSSKEAESRKPQVRTFQDLEQKETDGSSPAPKRFRSNEPSPTLDIVKTEPVEMKVDMDNTASHSREMIILKSELCEPEELSAATYDSVNENMYDESLDETNISEHDYDDCSEIEGGDQESQNNSNVKETLVAEAGKAIYTTLPKSGTVYEYAYQKFIKWCDGKGISEYHEEILLEYFFELATVMKMKSSSLWSHYSMIKSLMNIRQGVDISKYQKLRAYLKKQNEGYIPKKARTFTQEQLEKFLFEAPDEKYLAMKVILMIGVSGACRCDEMIKLKVDDVEDLGSLLHIKVPDSKTKKTRSFTVTGEKAINIYRKYAALRPANMGERRLFLKYTNGRCYRLTMGIHMIGSVPKEVASYLKLPNWQEYTGHCLRRTSCELHANNGTIVNWR